jgi:hypothetical protein
MAMAFPQWPGGAAAARGLAVNTLQFHARDGVLVQYVEVNTALSLWPINCRKDTSHLIFDLKA